MPNAAVSLGLLAAYCDELPVGLFDGHMDKLQAAMGMWRLVEFRYESWSVLNIVVLELRHPLFFCPDMDDADARIIMMEARVKAMKKPQVWSKHNVQNGHKCYF